MSQGFITAILSVLFYLSNLLGGGISQPAPPPSPEQQSYYVLGQTARIVGEKVIVRQGPSSAEAPVGTLQAGASVTVLDKSADWYKIRFAPNSDGWVQDYFLHFNLEQSRLTEGEKGPVVLGCYPLDGAAYNSLLENSGQLSALAPLGWRLDSYGTLSADFAPEEMGRALYFAGNQELKTYAVIRLETDPAKLLASSYLQDKALADIVAAVREWGLKGVQLDLTFQPQQPAELGAFVGELRAKLAAEGGQTLLAINLPNNPEDAFDYSALSDVADYLILKTGLNQKEENPGPLASAAWIEEALERISSQIPAEKIVLGIAGGGRDWPRMGASNELSYQEVMDLAASYGVSIKWNAQAKSPYFTYGADRQVWFENHYSLKYKLELARKHNLAGVAFLDLGREDPEVWSALAKTF